MDVINIATALNKKYIPYTIVMLTSLCINNRGRIRAFLFNSELNTDDVESMMNALEQYDIEIIPINVDSSKFGDKFFRNVQWSVEMYYRLMMTELIPETVDRLLYLDVDIIVNLSIAEMYNIPFDGVEMLVADDKGGKNFPSSYGAKHNEMFSEAYANGHRYFNSGVMLLNMELLRNRYNLQTYLKAFEEWNYEMDAPDQDILNYVHWRNVKYLDYKKYDYFAKVAHNDGVSYEQAKRDIAILHFAGDKPWMGDHFHYDIERIWWEYAKETPIYYELASAYVDSSITNSSLEEFAIEVTEENKRLKELLNNLKDKINYLINS